jgi:hypothetical protein
MIFDRRSELESQLSWAISRRRLRQFIFLKVKLHFSTLYQSGDEVTQSTLRGQIADIDLEIDKLEVACASL